MRWLAFVLVACSAPTPKPIDRVVAEPGHPQVAAPPLADSSVATRPNDGSVGTPIHVDGDPAEPVAPQAECAFERVVSCHDGLPTRTALQPSPFEWCARTTPPTKQSLYPNPAAMFSALETRAARTKHQDTCCYVEFTTRACD